MYETETKEAILQRMLDLVPVDLDKRQGSIIWDTLSPGSIEMSRLYTQLDNVLKLGFAGTSWGTYLEQRAAEVGLTKIIGETDTQLLVRYYERVRRPAASGNKSHYQQWAREAGEAFYPPLGDGTKAQIRSKVFPVWNGNGTIKVAVTDPDFKPPLAAFVTSAQTYIDPVPGLGDGQAPIGATVTVVGAVTKTIDVVFVVTTVAGKTPADVKTEFEPLLDQYMKDLAFVDAVTVVRYSRIYNLILDCPSVVDHTGLTVNGGTGNVSLVGEEVPVRGTVTVS